MCDPLYPLPPFTADVMTAILVSGVTSQSKIMFQPGGFTDFTVVDESKLDEMIDFSSETEVCPWAKYQRIDYCIIKESLGISVSFYGGFSGGKVSTSREFPRLFKHIDFTFNG